MWKFYLITEFRYPTLWLKLPSFLCLANISRHSSLECFRQRDLLFKSSRPEVFCEKGVLIDVKKFTGKHLCRSLFFNKLRGLRPAILLKKRFSHGCFPMNFATSLRTPYLQKTSGRLLLTIIFINLF